MRYADSTQALTWVQVVLYFLDAYKGEGEISYTEEQLIAAARLLIRPLLEKGYQNKALPVDDGILELMVARLFNSPEQSSESRLNRLTYCLLLRVKLMKAINCFYRVMLQAVW